MLRIWTQLCSAASVVLAAVALTGCAGTRIRSARAHFYASRFSEAETILSESEGAGANEVLLLMERGAVRQAMGKYELSTGDWLKAVDLIEDLETRSATEQGASLLVNDKTISFRGAPYERTLLRTFLAKNFLLGGMAEGAAVEARNIIENLQDLKGYPDDPYSRYMAGFCLELFRDPSNAALQYRNANKLVTDLTIDEVTGRISRTTSKKKPDEDAKDKGGAGLSHELVCFILIGRSPVSPGVKPTSTSQAPYAEILVGSKTLGRSYPLTDVAFLLARTEEKEALRTAAKDAARLGTKLAVAHQIKQQDELLGNIVELALLAMESPDDRRWGALPRWLQVARVPCPPDLRVFDARFKTASNTVFHKARISSPIARFGKTFVSFCRNLPPYPTGNAP